MDKWYDQNLPSSSSNIICSIDDLINNFKNSEIGKAQLFLILQEIVHTPIYYAHDSLEAAGKEVDFEGTINDISKRMGLNDLGLQIIKNTKSFYKDVKKENTSILKWGIYGLMGASTIATILAIPVIAPAIGGLMGLSGAAATASGLAILGGGSIAAGGLGMAGGMTLLVGGSGILGAIAGGAAGKLLSQLPQETIALNVIKVVNLIIYLNSNNGISKHYSDELLTEAKMLFIEFKQATEKELVINGINKDKKEIIQLLDILNVGLKRII